MEVLWSVVEVTLGIVSSAGLLLVWEWYRTRQRLRQYVKSYLKSVEFDWTNQTVEFALMHRVRVFELLLRKLQALQPRTPAAYRQV